MTAGEIRYESILNNGYDPEFNRFTGTVTISYSTGIAGSGLVGGSVVLEQPTLDEFFDAYSGVSNRITGEQTRELNDFRRAQADGARRASGIDGFINRVTATETEGYTFQEKTSGSLSSYLQTNKSFEQGSLFGSHAEALGCNLKGAQCTEFRSKKGAFGINGSLQVVLNANGNGYFDVDRFNPYQFPIGTFGHLFEILGPKVPGVSQTNFNGRSQSDLVDRLSRVRANYSGRR